MNDELDQINARILAAKERLEELKRSEREINKHLDKSLLSQQQAIVDEKATGAIEKDITSLQLKLSGTHRAMLQLSETLTGLEADRKAEQARIGNSQESLLRDEVNEIAGDIYRLFTEAVNKTLDLKTKVRELRAALKAQGPSAEHRSQRVTHLCTALEDGIALCLKADFPDVLFTNGERPMPDVLRRTVQKGSMR